jgi:hypothetical protein
VGFRCGERVDAASRLGGEACSCFRSIVGASLGYRPRPAAGCNQRAGHLGCVFRVWFRGLRCWTGHCDPLDEVCAIPPDGHLEKATTHDSTNEERTSLLQQREVIGKPNRDRAFSLYVVLARVNVRHCAMDSCGEERVSRLRLSRRVLHLTMSSSSAVSGA